MLGTDRTEKKKYQQRKKTTKTKSINVAPKKKQINIAIIVYNYQLKCDIIPTGGTANR